MGGLSADAERSRVEQNQYNQGHNKGIAGASYVYTGKLYIWGCVAYVIGVLMLMPALPNEAVSYPPLRLAAAVFELIKPTMEHGVRRVLLSVGFSFAVFFGLYLCVRQLLKNRVSKDAVTAAEQKL
ncbi:MAG: hypothetical protein KUG81_00990 [Gammaproteobacteria bacterium]|nr:hypothetical protein [Gammaproteobacteria bacterium]